MKKALFMIVAASMSILAGCQKEQSALESKSNDVIRINVGQIAPATKVAANNIEAATLSFSFEEGDEVAFVNVSNFEMTKFICTVPSNGTFEKKDGKALDPAGEYYIFYPPCAFDYLMSGEGAYSENYRGNQIPKEHMIMEMEHPVSGAVTEFNLASHNTIIHFQLKGDAKIGSIEYKTKSHKVSAILHCGEGVQLSETPTHFYLDVLSLSAAGFSLVFKDASGNELGEKETDFNLNSEAARMKVVDFDVPITVNASSLPEGALSGEFSVSATKKVHFSNGNLVATINDSGTPTAWKFAANQFNYIGESGANKTIGNAAGDVDLFGWSTSNNGGTSTTDNYGIKTSTSPGDYSGDFYDWGKAYCASKSISPDNTWRTLSTEEWLYLFSNHSYKWATVNNVVGYVIAPDGFNGTLSDSYADDAALAVNNLVFLPAAGYRFDSRIYSVGEFGFYWSSTADGNDYAYDAAFNSSIVYSDYTDNRSYGYSVRLITDVK